MERRWTRYCDNRERSLIKEAGRLRRVSEKTDDIDADCLRDRAIRQLLESVDFAFKKFQDTNIDLKTRQGWFEKHTSAVLALNQLLKDLQMKKWEIRLQEVEKHGIQY